MDRSEHTANKALAESARIHKHNADTMAAWVETNRRAAELRREREATARPLLKKGWFAW
jgi:hypothetical protein